MRGRAWLAAAFIAAAFAASSSAGPADGSMLGDPPIAGRYREKADPTRVVTITRLTRHVVYIEGVGWEGVGMQSGSACSGGVQLPLQPGP